MDSDKIAQETAPRRCGACIYCVKDDGEPYYCAIRDLYYFVNENDKPCSRFQK